MGSRGPIGCPPGKRDLALGLGCRRLRDGLPSAWSASPRGDGARPRRGGCWNRARKWPALRQLELAERDRPAPQCLVGESRALVVAPRRDAELLSQVREVLPDNASWGTWTGPRRAWPGARPAGAEAARRSLDRPAQGRARGSPYRAACPRSVRSPP